MWSSGKELQVNFVKMLGIILLCIAWLAVLLALVLPIAASLFLGLGIEVPRFWARSEKVFVFGWATWRLARR